MPVVINEFEAVAEAGQSGGDTPAKAKAPPPHIVRRDLRSVAWRVARLKAR